jgi:hypothetical protein
MIRRVRLAAHRSWSFQEFIMKQDHHSSYTMRNLGSADGSALFNPVGTAPPGMRVRRSSPPACPLSNKHPRARAVATPDVLDSGVAMHATFEFKDGVADQMRGTTLRYPGKGTAGAGHAPLLPGAPLPRRSQGTVEGRMPAIAAPAGAEKPHPRQPAPDIAADREAWIRRRYEHIHRDDTYDDLVRRAAFSRYDAGLLKDWIRAAGDAVKKTLAGEKYP